MCGLNLGASGALGRLLSGALGGRDAPWHMTRSRGQEHTYEQDREARAIIRVVHTHGAPPQHLRCVGTWVLWRCFGCLGAWMRLGALGGRDVPWHMTRSRGQEHTYEQDRRARASVRVAHMEPCFTQLRGQAKSHPACTHRSGPLPASLASATCPLLRGTLESAGASCALTGTRGTGWSAAKHARERTCAGSSACSPHARECSTFGFGRHNGRARPCDHRAEPRQRGKRCHDRTWERTHNHTHVVPTMQESSVLLAQGSHEDVREHERHSVAG